MSVVRAYKPKFTNWIGVRRQVIMEHVIVWNLRSYLAIGIAGMVLACWVRQVRTNGYDEGNNFAQNGSISS